MDAKSLSRSPAAPVEARPSWLDRVLSLRDRLLASPEFRRRATAFPLTRFVARRRARALFDLCAGFVYSQTLVACLRLHLFEALADGPQTLDALSRRLRLPPEPALRLLEAAGALRLAERRSGGRYGLGALGAALVGNPGLVAMVAHHGMLYDDLRDPVALLRRERRPATELGRYWPYAGSADSEALGTDQVAPYTALMAASQPLVAEEILDAYPLRGHLCLLDVGGGDGSFLTRVAARAPHLRLRLFDLPAVADEARARFAALGLLDRATAFGGDARVDPLPDGADVVSLVRVLHDHDDEAALRLLRAARRALPPYGTLLIAEPMADTPGAETVGAYFHLYLFAMGQGRPRSPAEITDLLRAAGFGRVVLKRTRTPLLTRLIVARSEG